ncbi:MAG: hypothetical protein AB1515_00460 [Nitrospirota bacterium]
MQERRVADRRIETRGYGEERRRFSESTSFSYGGVERRGAQRRCRDRRIRDRRKIDASTPPTDTAS